MRLVMLALILLSGCTVQLEDKRLTREEVSTALKQRDELFEKMAEAIKAQDERLIAIEGENVKDAKK